jgi:hypothetical protein
MALDRSARRRSLNGSEGAQPHRRPMSSDGAAEKRLKRHTWSFNPERRSKQPAAEECSNPLILPEVDFGAGSFPELVSQQLTSALLLGSSGNANGHSSVRSVTGGVSNSNTRPAPKRTTSQQSELGTIMESKYIEITTMAQTRGAAPKVKRWDAKTRTTSVWDCLRRVSFIASCNC